MARILVVDDDALVLEALRSVLLSAAHDVVAADDGVRALKAFRSEAFDLVITDIVMPDGEGLDLIRSLVALRPAVPIIAMSGSPHAVTGRYLEMATLLGAQRVLPKPFDAATLLDMVRDVLAG